MLPFLALLVLVPLLDGNRKLCTCDPTYVFFSFLFFILNQSPTMRIIRKMNCNSLNFLCFIPTFKTMYRVTGTAPDIGVRQKPTYRFSGYSFSGSSGFSGSFLNFLVLGLLVIDGFDDSGFAGFSFLVLLVLVLLVLGGGFSGFSSSSGSSSKRNRNLRGQRHNLSTSLLFYTQSINHQQCKSHEDNTNNNNTNLSFWRWNRLNLSFYTYLPFKKSILFQQ